MAHAATTRITVERWRRASPLDRITLYSTFGLLLFGPLAFGTTEPWSKFVLECGAVGQQLEVLEDAADVPAQHRHLRVLEPGELAAADDDPARRRLELLEEEAHDRRLPGA